MVKLSFASMKYSFPNRIGINYGRRLLEKAGELLNFQSIEVKYFTEEDILKNKSFCVGGLLLGKTVVNSCVFRQGRLFFTAEIIDNTTNMNIVNSLDIDIIPVCSFFEECDRSRIYDATKNIQYFEVVKDCTIELINMALVEVRNQKIRG